MAVRRPVSPAVHRLVLASGNWVAAFEDCKRVTTSGAAIRRSDPVENFAELYYRAALTDAIAEVCDGAPLGIRPHVVRQLRGLLSEKDWQRLGLLIFEPIRFRELEAIR